MHKAQSILLLLLVFALGNAHAERTVITINQSNQPIWVGAEGKLVDPSNPFNPVPVNPNRGGWYLAPNGGSVTVKVPDGWEGRFWGRTNCEFDEFGNGSCETGNCTAGLYCNGLWGKAATLAEMKFNGWNNLDFYDVSLIDGFNVPIKIVPVPGTYTPNGDKYYAGAAGCSTNVNLLAPSELAIKNSQGQVVAWMATCEKWNIDKYCCYDNDPATCHPNEYSVILKNACPDAYSYVTDHTTSTFASSAGTAYQVIFPQPTPPLNAGKVNFYQHCNFTGSSSALDIGDYTLSQLRAKGVVDNDVSSIKVLPGYKAQLFEHDNFTGASITVTGEKSCLVADGWNDRMSSVRITQNACTPTAITAQLNVNNGAWQNTNTITVNVGDRVTLGPQPLNNSGWVWTGPNNFSSTNRELVLDNIQSNQAGSYTAKFTNSEGCESVMVYRISVNSTAFTKKIQAESFNYMAGVQLENGTNAEGGVNVGYIDAGDWLAYTSITLPASGEYLVEYRVASANGGGRLALEINAASSVLHTVDIASTGGWYNWVTVSKTMTLSAGTYDFGIAARAGGWNIDSWTIKKL